MIIQIILYISAIFFPWVAFLLMGNVPKAILAVLMQVSIIGWPFATRNAFRAIHQYVKDEKE